MSDHYPIPVTVGTGELGPWDPVVETIETQIRCGCTHSLEHMYGHEKDEQ